MNDLLDLKFLEYKSSFANGDMSKLGIQFEIEEQRRKQQRKRELETQRIIENLEIENEAIKKKIRGYDESQEKQQNLVSITEYQREMTNKLRKELEHEKQRNEELEERIVNIKNNFMNEKPHLEKKGTLDSMIQIQNEEIILQDSSNKTGDDHSSSNQQADKSSNQNNAFPFGRSSSSSKQGLSISKKLNLPQLQINHFSKIQKQRDLGIMDLNSPLIPYNLQKGRPQLKNSDLRKGSQSNLMNPRSNEGSEYSYDSDMESRGRKSSLNRSLGDLEFSGGLNFPPGPDLLAEESLKNSVLIENGDKISEDLPDNLENDDFNQKYDQNLKTTELKGGGTYESKLIFNETNDEMNGISNNSDHHSETKQDLQEISEPLFSIRIIEASTQYRDSEVTKIDRESLNNYLAVRDSHRKSDQKQNYISTLNISGARDTLTKESSYNSDQEEDEYQQKQINTSKNMTDSKIAKSIYTDSADTLLNRSTIKSEIVENSDQEANKDSKLNSISKKTSSNDLIFPKNRINFNKKDRPSADITIKSRNNLRPLSILAPEIQIKRTSIIQKKTDHVDDVLSSPVIFSSSKKKKQQDQNQSKSRKNVINLKKHLKEKVQRPSSPSLNPVLNIKNHKKIIKSKNEEYSRQVSIPGPALSVAESRKDILVNQILLKGSIKQHKNESIFTSSFSKHINDDFGVLEQKRQPSSEYEVAKFEMDRRTTDFNFRRDPNNLQFMIDIDDQRGREGSFNRKRTSSSFLISNKSPLHPANQESIRYSNEFLMTLDLLREV